MGLITKEPVMFYGKSDYNYYFKAYDLETEFSSCEAVYIFTKRYIPEGKTNPCYSCEAVYIFTKRYIPEGKTNPCYKRLYVGETNNLATVIQEHINSPCLQKHGVDSICVRLDKDTDKKSRCEIVRDIIAYRTRPPCNVP